MRTDIGFMCCAAMDVLNVVLGVVFLAAFWCSAVMECVAVMGYSCALFGSVEHIMFCSIFQCCRREVLREVNPGKGDGGEGKRKKLIYFHLLKSFRHVSLERRKKMHSLGILRSSLFILSSIWV